MNTRSVESTNDKKRTPYPNDRTIKELDGVSYIGRYLHSPRPEYFEAIDKAIKGSEPFDTGWLDTSKTFTHVRIQGYGDKVKVSVSCSMDGRPEIYEDAMFDLGIDRDITDDEMGAMDELADEHGLRECFSKDMEIPRTSMADALKVMLEMESDLCEELDEDYDKVRGWVRKTMKDYDPAKDQTL